VRWLGTFLEEPPDVPGAVLDFMVGQLGVTDPSQVKRYAERTPGLDVRGRPESDRFPPPRRPVCGRDPAIRKNVTRTWPFWA
jgi:hypothetical protein